MSSSDGEGKALSKSSDEADELTRTDRTVGSVISGAGELDEPEDSNMVRCLVGAKAPRVQGTAYMPDGSFAQVDTETMIGSKCLLLYWYPLDFSFLSPTEVAGISASIEEFRKYNCEVIGISCDSHFTHRAMDHTNANCGGLENSVNHPLMSDISLEVTKSFGFMLDGLAVSCRASVVIDKQGIIQAVMQNNLPMGRGIDEALRLVASVVEVEAAKAPLPNVTAMPSAKPADSNMKPDDSSTNPEGFKPPARSAEPAAGKTSSTIPTSITEPTKPAASTKSTKHKRLGILDDVAPRPAAKKEEENKE